MSNDTHLEYFNTLPLSVNHSLNKVYMESKVYVFTIYAIIIIIIIILRLAENILRERYFAVNGFSYTMNIVLLY